MWMIAIVPFFTMPFFIMGLLADEPTTAIVLFIIPGFAANYAMGATLAMVQTLSPINMRAVSSAIMMLFVNLIGMGLGPLLVGVLSDLLTHRYGEDALGVALACFSLIAVGGSAFMVMWSSLGETEKTKRIKRLFQRSGSTVKLTA
jgi:MFS family permease